MDILLYSFFAFIYLLIQTTLFNQMVLFSIALPQVHLLFLLMLPFRISFTWTLLIAFGYGLAYDFLSSNVAIGLGAFSSVLLVTLREGWLNLAVPKIYYDSREELVLPSLPINQLLLFIAPLLFIYLIVYYFMDGIGNFDLGMVLLKTFSGFIYTLFLSTILIILFYSGKR
ncbi:MAG: hypothetical protein EBS07_03680 [Sphingobacteriia bacterium]|nr:hypothetical protein [Sphingobacteriia bacterium]